jgi:hypothetical protein
MEKHHRGCPQPTSDELRERWAQWTQAMELSHAMLMTGLRAKIGPDGDILAAYRAWYDTYQSLKWRDANEPQNTTKVTDVS